MSRLRVAFTAIAFVGAWVGIGGAGADEPTRIALRFDAPRACPAEERFRQELGYRSSKLVIDPGAESSARLEVAIAERGGTFTGRLVLALGGAEETRTVAGARCESVVAALSLAAAVLLDPEARTDPLPESLPPVPPAPEPEADAAPPPIADAGPPETGAPDSTPEPFPPPLPPRDEKPWVLSAEAALGGTTAVHGIDPLAAVGIEARRIVRTRSRGAARLLVFATPGGEVTALPGTVAYGAYGARVDLCPLSSTPAGTIRIDACAFGSAWLLPVRSPTAAIDRAQLRTLFTPGALARAGVGVGPLTLALDLGLGVHIAEERFLIEPRGEVFRVPRVYGVGGLGASLPIP